MLSRDLVPIKARMRQPGVGGQAATDWADSALAHKRGAADLLAKAQSAQRTGKVLDEPRNPAVIILPLLQRSIFLSGMVEYLFATM
jgi:hypothetical protein